jgi:hypothetical protein
MTQVIVTANDVLSFPEAMTIFGKLGQCSSYAWLWMNGPYKIDPIICQKVCF